MKKILATRNKKAFLPMFIISASSVAGSIILLCIPNFKWLGFIGAFTMTIALIESILGLFVAPSDIIILEDNQLTVYCGGLAMRKITVPVSSIKSIYAEKMPKSHKNEKIGIISMQISTEKGDKKISVTDVLDKNAVITALTDLIADSAESYR